MSISRTLCASLLALVQVLPAASYAQSDTERQKAHVVSRLYQATYGAEDRCKPSKLASLEFGKAFNQFSVAYPELIRLLKASPHLTTAKEQYAKFLAHHRQTLMKMRCLRSVGAWAICCANLSKHQGQKRLWTISFKH